MAGITSAGAGSGIQMEEIIAASLKAKRTKFEQQMVRSETTAKTTLSGLGQLKSALSDFNKALEKFTSGDAFSKRAIKVTQPTDNPVLQVTGKEGASNGNYDIVVNRLSQGSKFESAPGTFANISTTVATADGKLTFAVGDKSFDVDIAAGDSLNSVRKKINESSKNFGVTANIVNMNGESRLVLDSKIGGDGKDLSIKASTSELEVFATPAPDAPNSKMVSKQSASSAEIQFANSDIKFTSDTNTFDNAIQDLSITVLKVSDNVSSDPAVTDKKSTNVAISTDVEGVKKNLQDFVTAYNTLLDKMDAMGKRSSIVAGVRQDNGGVLAGDASISSIENFLFSTLTGTSAPDDKNMTLFTLGVDLGKKGRLEIDTKKFDDAMKNNFEQLGSIFTGENGLASKMKKELDKYTQRGGVIDKRNDVYNSELRDISSRRASFESNMVKYEESLRQQYGKLDSLMVKMNQSASSMASALSRM
ncbi:flagellar hook-associated protein 2 [Aeromonas diversa CDC 2478-85]|uniref:Flagellar hook-associated protein 2 n=1 Tax=Aeromonas diversa CDC 2478-85 TaxID=1268237 RepID=N9V9K2_9GAMM|nr:flagellar filament capping protein FliD [Aeromonas diversa]ENY71962.1 flagellar hook-associated protein 2 [Aeromonas diversa CDC 2478-85]